MNSVKKVQCGTRTISNMKTLLHVPAALHLVDRCASCTYAVWNPKYTNIRDFDYSLVLSVALQRIHTPEPIPGHFLLWSSNKSHRLTHSQKSYESFWSLSNRSVYNEKFMRVLLHRWRERHGGSERKTGGNTEMCSRTPGETTGKFRAKMAAFIIHRTWRTGLCNIYLWYWLDCEWLPAYSPSHTVRWDHNPTAETACFPRARFN